MDQIEALATLRRVGAFFTDGHFVYASGRHGSTYVEMKNLFQYPKSTSSLCREIAKAFADTRFDSITGPDSGGVVVANWVAQNIKDICRRQVTVVPTVKIPIGDFLIRRKFLRHIFNRRVLVVDDVVNMGTSVGKVIGMLPEYSADIVGLGAIFNRGGSAVRDLVFAGQSYFLIDQPYDSWEENDCPLCKEGMPVDLNHGHGKCFVMKKRPIVLSF